MREVLEDLRDVKQMVDEKEYQYRKRLNEAIFKYGNVHLETRKITSIRRWVTAND